MPALSVVVPACGTSPHPRQTVGSLLADAPSDLEVIVVDDGSTDEMLPIAVQLAEEDARVRVIHQTDALAAAARNAGLAVATRDYVGFADDNYEFEPGWVRGLLSAASHQRPAIVKGEVRLLGREGALITLQTCARMARHSLLHWSGFMDSAIYRRDFVQDHGLHFAAESDFDGIDFQVRAVVAALLDQEQISLCPQAVCRCLRRPGTTTGTALSRHQVASCLRTYQGLHELFLRHYRQLPPTGVGAQYFTWTRNLFDLARRAGHPDDGAAANALAQQLSTECPCCDELEQERLALETTAPGSRLHSP